MEILPLAFAFAAGLAVGGGVLAVMRADAARRLAEATAALQAERAALGERLAAAVRGEEAAAALARQKEHALEDLRSEVSRLHGARAELAAELDHERRSAAEKIALLEDARERLAETFRALSAEALGHNNQGFLDLARTVLERHQEGARVDLDQRKAEVDRLVLPLAESLKGVESQVRALEVERAQAYTLLTEQVRALAESQGRLQRETAQLVRALRAPQGRGRWGEVQLRRVVEMAGMLEHCDFVEQASVGTDEGRLRPDLLVRLPGGRNVVVDAKAPLAAYLEALEAGDDETRRALLADHARQVRAHLGQLASKSYWSRFEPSPEFVVLFLPGETFFSAALEQDPSLLEHGAERRVLVATPTTLIALLRAVAYGWRHERMARGAEEVARLGRDLHERLRVLASHFTAMRRGLESTVDAYNRVAGSLESRVLPAARRFRDLGAAGGDEIGPVEATDRAPRRLESGEERVPEEEEVGAP